MKRSPIVEIVGRKDLNLEETTELGGRKETHIQLLVHDVSPTWSQPHWNSPTPSPMCHSLFFSCFHHFNPFQKMFLRRPRWPPPPNCLPFFFTLSLSQAHVQNMCPWDWVRVLVTTLGEARGFKWQKKKSKKGNSGVPEDYWETFFQIWVIAWFTCGGKTRITNCSWIIFVLSKNYRQN